MEIPTALFIGRKTRTHTVCTVATETKGLLTGSRDRGKSHTHTHTHTHTPLKHLPMPLTPLDSRYANQLMAKGNTINL